MLSGNRTQACRWLLGAAVAVICSLVACSEQAGGGSSTDSRQTAASNDSDASPSQQAGPNTHGEPDDAEVSGLMVTIRPDGESLENGLAYGAASSWTESGTHHIRVIASQEPIDREQMRSEIYARRAHESWAPLSAYASFTLCISEDENTVCNVSLQGIDEDRGIDQLCGDSRRFPEIDISQMTIGDNSVEGQIWLRHDDCWANLTVNIPLVRFEECSPTLDEHPEPGLASGSLAATDENGWETTTAISHGAAFTWQSREEDRRYLQFELTPEPIDLSCATVALREINQSDLRSWSLDGDRVRLSLCQAQAERSIDNNLRWELCGFEFSHQGYRWKFEAGLPEYELDELEVSDQRVKGRIRLHRENETWLDYEANLSFDLPVNGID